MLYKVSFEIKTSKYKNVGTDLDTVVVAESYNDAAIAVAKQWSVYSGFKIGAVTPVGDPELRRKPCYELNIDRTFE
jgi:hypothetical protein